MISAAVVTASVRVTLLSDIHYDPQYGTTKAFSQCVTSNSSVWGVAGCDTSPQLIQRALDDVSRQGTSFIFYGGDWQRHDYHNSGLAPAALFTDLSERFRNVTVDGSHGTVAFSASLGNNDVVPDYYFEWESAASVQELTARVQAMETAGLLTATEAGVMEKCGYYTYEKATLHVIVLHTLLWAFRLRPYLSDAVADPCSQFAFLKSELQKVRDSGKRAVILGHVPPGLDTYKVLKGGFKTPPDDLYWKPEYLSAYDAIIYAYKDVVALQLFGHTHRFALQVFPANGVLSIILPAISPIFSNNPSYLLADFREKDWFLQDVRIRYSTRDGVFHAGTSAKAALKISADLASLPQLRSAVKKLATDDEAWKNYLQMYCGGETRPEVFPGEACDAHCRYVVVCSMLESNYTSIQNCVADFFADSSEAPCRTSPGVVATILIFSVMVLAVAVLLVRMARSGQTTLACHNFTKVGWWRSLLSIRPTSSIVVETELHVPA
ncbi:hypothetical protein ABB37_03525 [Leptomonas pyrrhocoris]|uniref:Calcineurin-like phosphoesterase domain-containing protein n=1 Tax=Leptomonas pyrrhocoris TaxID=157538 RepID=A0A0M9G544_LEPPY|nr:hypothetical protein ABB37_03525 [Leptomonas pyrrhocoris]KPA82463.1 hypothetical protein ABB37_03525 [Leptomonas pyrrhocoris]|eukprot:XP_015660902.1 hypothetical protein ABB37_03525 [Leptomonas pyrrhocoris]